MSLVSLLLLIWIAPTVLVLLVTVLAMIVRGGRSPADGDIGAPEKMVLKRAENRAKIAKRLVSAPAPERHLGAQKRSQGEREQALVDAEF